MMENALRFPHSHSHDYDEETDGGLGWRSLGGFSIVRNIIDVTHIFNAVAVVKQEVIKKQIISSSIRYDALKTLICADLIFCYRYIANRSAGCEQNAMWRHESSRATVQSIHCDISLTTADKATMKGR